MLDEYRRAHAGRELDRRPADLLVLVEAGLVHEVHREHTVRGVAQAAPRADRLEPPPCLGSDAAARDQISGEQRELGVCGTHILDKAKRPVEADRSGRSPMVAKPTPAIRGTAILEPRAQLPSELRRLLMS